MHTKRERETLGFWTIGKKLTASSAVLLAMMLTISSVALTRFFELESTLHSIVQQDWKKTQAVGTMTQVLGENTIYTIMQAIAPAHERQSLRNSVLANRERFIASSQFLQDNVVSATGKQALHQLEQERTKFVQSQNKFYEHIDSGASDAALAELMGITLPTLSAVKVLLKEIEQMAVQNADVNSQEAVTKIQRAEWLIVGIALSAFAFGTLVAWRTARSITHPIQQAVVLAQEVAQGNLTHQVHITTQDETAQLLTALNTMNAGLKNIVTDVRNASASIASATSQIATGNMDLSGRTEEQASSLEQTAAAMQQIMAAVEQNLENTRHAHSLAEQATGVATQGGSVVGQAVDAMQKVKSAGDKISEIVGVIEGIAFQTNILALNAAVEAARAGEQGRGFAVVATEVRALAGRSANASKEIKALIQDSVGDIAHTSTLVEQAGSSMQAILSSVRNVTDLISEVAHSSKEQTSSLEQINSAVTQMDTVTQQNAALVEEGAAAAHSLESQAAGLVSTVSIFKTDEDRHALATSTHGQHTPSANPTLTTRLQHNLAEPSYRLQPFAD